jgi:putative membrane protein
MIGARSLSLERIIRAVLYLILGVACLGLVVSGKVSLFLHPRMSPWIAISGAVFLALCALETSRVRLSPHSPLPVLSYYALLLVIVVVTQFPFMGPVSPGRLDMPSVHYRVPEKPAVVQAAALNPGDDDYWQVYNLLYDTPGYYAGREITLAGFIFRDKHFPEHVALVGRNLMWCCSADMGLIGFMATGADLDSFPAGTWVEVRGVLDVISFDVTKDGKTKPVPLIKVGTIRLLREHPSQNIFPR